MCHKLANHSLGKSKLKRHHKFTEVDRLKYKSIMIYQSNRLEER
jgi:hypothetical protein